MRVPPGRLLAAACCAGLVAGPASIARATSTGGALSTGAFAAPRAPGPSAVHLTADPSRPTVGQTVRLAVIDPPAGATGFAWDLSGPGVFGRRAGSGPRSEVTFSSPGIHTVAVRVHNDGRVALGVLTLTVARGAAPRRVPAARVSHAAHAHIAGDPAVAVADFHFTPATTTIHVGDTITWANGGPSSHTATARDGSFDTGVLKKGQSASHTFTRAGTFAYVCQIHPFMHGTIVVEAGTTTTTAATTTTTATTSPPTATTAAVQAGPTLPNTGFNVLGGLCAGLLLLGLGAGLRRGRAR